MDMAVRTSLPWATFFLLLAILVVAAPARGGSQFGVRISIVSQCGSQPGALFGPDAQLNTNVACLPSSTLFSVRRIGFGASAGSQGVPTNGNTNTNLSGQGTASANSNNAGAAGFSPSTVGILPSPSGSSSAEQTEKIVYVVF